MEQLDLIEMYIDEEVGLIGSDAISIVEEGAIEEDFIALSKVKEESVALSTVDSDKKILIGAALVPNKEILRLSGDKKYKIVFSPETVGKTAHSFIQNGFQNNVTLDHASLAKDVSVIESWVVEDTQKDKSSKYGLNYQPGTWVVMMKVNNDETWQRVKNGELNGFSIEGRYASKMIENFKEQNLSKQNNVREELIQGLLDIFNSKLINYGKKTQR